MNNGTASSSPDVNGPFLDGAPRNGQAVIYLRVSSTRQVGRDYDPEGISIPAQRAACHRRAEQLGLTIVGEYVEPGRSATEMTKRAVFQQMLARIRHTSDVDHVVVYKLSRLARNRVDDALVMADLRQRGITLISATESVDNTPIGQLMHGILATFNEYQSRESGADIAYKMGQKARNGGTISRARLGYLNHTDRSDGRDIRTIIVDPERAPLVRLGFELFAADNLTLDQLSERLYLRGLRTRPTAQHPAKRVSISKLARMLRDRYYLGYVTYQGEELSGRHEPLIDQHLFDRVQAVLDARATSGERRRVHLHYLKGTLYCGHCHRTGNTGRMIIQHTVTRRGDEYTYFFCRNRQQGTCPAPYVNVAIAEQAVERYYTTISQQQITDALITLAKDDTANNSPRRTVDPAQFYRDSADDERRLLNLALFRRLYLADDRITNHEPWPAAPQT
ncbi:recombinase family protein [Kibdelosporangium philippinense]|uniref:Recombinase family protein n=2 Tax=Kibdelosporangium philippinense TaxID=211113 RepID=A0ABS8ZQW3_9PSEU|nr:recombinase family protein [Kibdelosporangium philippinense]MCE7008202.1 recombinase family protein [Kibdelosporangium philippinense]